MSDPIVVEVVNDPIVIEMTPEGADGKSLRPMGDWSATEPYIALDLVYYRGNSYIAMKVVPVGTLPTNTEYWMVNASGENETYWGNIHGKLEEQTDLQAALDAKADADEVYTKSETDALLDDKADADSVYTKSEADDLLALKADADSVYTKSEANALLAVKADADNVYTKAESDSLLGEKADADNVYTKAEADSLLGEKADANNVYTKAEADSLLGEKADADNVYTKSEADSLLNEKADADEVYTKSETDSLLDEKADAADVYEKSEVYTKTETDTLLGAKADADDVYDKTDVYTKTQTDNLLAAKADASDVYTKTETDNLLADKADADDVYDKDATDALLDEKADIIVTSASDALVHLTDAAAMPVKALSAAIEPVQDLHGYDNPWPAGGNSNIWDEQWMLGTFNTNHELVSGSYVASKNPIPVSPSTTYYCKCSANVKFEFYESDMTWISELDVATTLPTFTTPATASYMLFRTFAAYGSTYNNDIAINYPSTVTTYSPYANVCPISGWDEVTVRRTGKNLLSNNLLPEDYSSRGVDFTVNPDKSVTVSGTLTNYSEVSKGYGNVYLPAGTYIIGGGISNKYRLRIGYADDPTQLIDHVGAAAKQYTFTEPVGLNIQLRVSLSAGASVSGTFYPMIRPAADADDTYEPYSGTSVTIGLGETCYGGILDVLTGELTVTYKEVPLTDIHYFTTGGEYLPRIRFTETAINYGNGYCSHLPLNQNGVNAGTTIGFTVRDTYIIINLEGHTYATSSESTSALSDYITANPTFKIVYPLATPVTIPLSANTLSLLKGENNLWSDTGDTSVTYRADTKLYIDGKLAAAIAELQALILENNE